jgi:hypothetical protein
MRTWGSIGREVSSGGMVIPSLAVPVYFSCHTLAVSSRSSFTVTFDCESDNARFRRYDFAESAIVTKRPHPS